ncbi:HNH endonuclease [Sporosarcina sp. PTS2304]|uniref:HNH endonuclease n=1 Tax=Sporosarcina sp. PTS2304 TaxID=2283194 RepID=UPI000E0DD2E3|nr:HNH endonuclease [Sporosarcina sp. PTS2304]AXI00970.1 HNH endonuclease [Sporosarcina sp. PTS2304]
MTNYSPFRKIQAKEQVFIETRIRVADELESFRLYAEYLTVKDGKSKGDSGKARSYAGYLIRSIIFFEEIFDAVFPAFESIDAYHAVEQLRNIPSYKSFNAAEGSFLNAAINCFQSYIIHRNSLQEHPIDRAVDEYFYSTKQSELILDLPVISEATERYGKVQIAGRQAYPRNIKETIKSKSAHRWRCEMDQNHKTFTDQNSRPYVEGHHLLPMATQDLFHNTIDFAENIACLCPTCHRQIHYAIKDEKLPLVETLYERRKHKYEQFGILIQKDELLSFYGIL